MTSHKEAIKASFLHLSWEKQEAAFTSFLFVRVTSGELRQTKDHKKRQKEWLSWVEENKKWEKPVILEL